MPWSNLFGGLATVVLGPDHRGSRPTGLILITGSTKSGKSAMARALCEEQLGRLRTGWEQRRRFPHFVTVEDPIEIYYAKAPSEAAALGVDYTPRQRPDDAPGILPALLDARRQTPDLVFIGEVRERDDWAHVMSFAGTGHLVIATSHAGSLLEAMNDLLHVMDARSPASRGYVAERVHAVIHLRLCRYGSGEVPIPTVWRRDGGRDLLVADGLASILPHRDETRPSLGRLFFASRLRGFFEVYSAGIAVTQSTRDSRADRASQMLCKQARGLDLRGE